MLCYRHRSWADPGLYGVCWSALLIAGLAVTLLVTEHYHCFASTELCCLVIDVHVWMSFPYEQISQELSCYVMSLTTTPFSHTMVFKILYYSSNRRFYFLYIILAFMFNFRLFQPSCWLLSAAVQYCERCHRKLCCKCNSNYSNACSSCVVEFC